MKVGIDTSTLLLILCSLVYAGLEVNALSYDYKASIECLANPPKPQYGGGIIKNPELNEGLKGWSSFGEAKIRHSESQAGNKFIVAHKRHKPYDSISQELYLENDKIYALSAWIQVSSGNVPVTAVFKTTGGFIHAGSVVGESNCWSMLKGGLTVDESGPAHLYFESNDTSVEIWVDSISLQPFTEEQWKSHQQQSIEKAHKRNVRIQAVDAQGNPLPNATISFRQKRPSFPFGCAINKNILTNQAYQNWFTSRFTVTTFEDEMKWYSTESSPGRLDYSVSDALLDFASRHGVSVRGHNVFWDDPRYQPWWLGSLRRKQLAVAAFHRVFSVMSRYRGKLIAWDVVNENLHFGFFERRVARTATEIFYNWAKKADAETTLFMNEFNTIESSTDSAASAAKYVRKLREIQRFPGNGNMKMGIGLEGHFSKKPNLAYMRASIDTLSAAGLPIWITELDVSSDLNQAWYLEQILREARSHPHVNGIVMWAAWRPQGCYRMCLTDNNFRNLPTGDVVDKLLREWGWKGTVSGTTDAGGFFETSLFHGDYEVKITHPSVKNSTLARILNVAPSNESHETQLLLQV